MLSSCFFVCDVTGEVQSMADKGKIFRDLHTRRGTFVIPNPWDQRISDCSRERAGTRSAAIAPDDPAAEAPSVAGTVRFGHKEESAMFFRPSGHRPASPLSQLSITSLVTTRPSRTRQNCFYVQPVVWMSRARLKGSFGRRIDSPSRKQPLRSRQQRSGGGNGPQARPFR
jgi:hypothetical protein